MPKDNIVQTKSYCFAVKIVKTCKQLDQQKDFTLLKQLLKAGTSIGANVEEAIGAQSRKDFISKMSIAYKEARETIYWLRLLFDTDCLKKDVFDVLLADCTELLKIISKILITTKSEQ
jgi:four helix bundle protein